MPGMNGLDAMVAIRQEFPDARIIITDHLREQVQNAMNGGARAYLLKTHLDKELLGTIRAVPCRKVEASS
jgi:DNA-binding NarL/FixJ family response regulator